MPKLTNPTTFSTHYSVDRRQMARLGVLDPTLQVDVKLFMDPLLFQESGHKEMNQLAVKQYRLHFERVASLLEVSRKPGDVAWRNAVRFLRFPEIQGTCLGYGAASIAGSGWGPLLTDRLTATAKEIVDIGVQDPDLFLALALIEEGVGPDLISDMATNVAVPALAAFNARILRALGLRGEEFRIGDQGGTFMRNPFSKSTPVILVPTDVLRTLPIANDWDSVADAAAQNSALRREVNAHIAHIWARKTKRDKKILRHQALRNREAFECLLSSIRRVPSRAYDTEVDADGLLRWSRVAQEQAERYPLALRSNIETADDLIALVSEIIVQFRHLVEQRGINRELFKPDKRPRHESTAQRLFFAIAHAYCKANNVDITPEADTGTGNVDFKFSKGFSIRVLVEIKLSSNTNLVNGYAGQLEEYKKSEETKHAVYLVLDVGRMGRKWKELERLRDRAHDRKEPYGALELVDARLTPSPSKKR